MRANRIISLVLAIICIVPAIFIPSTWGLSLSDQRVDLGDAEVPQGELMSSVYYLLDGYYVLFIMTSLFPFLFFSFNASILIAMERSRGKNNNGKGRNNEGSLLFKEEIYPKVSVIIPCYNEAVNISSTVTNCFKQDYRGELEIIIVDDGSRDGTWSIGRIFKSSEKGRQIHIFHKENGGKASALKFGINKARGSIILMTDGDSHIHPNAVSSIVETFRDHPDAGIVGGYVFIRNLHAGYLNKLQQLEYIITQHLIRVNQSEDGSVLIAPGPIFGMRADLARTLPPLDRTVVEDCDLTMTVLPTGYTTRATTKARSYTSAPTTWKAWFRQRRRWIYGQFQAWRENQWHLKRNPWGLYTYFTWVWTTVSVILLLMITATTFLFIAEGSDYYRFIEFVSIRSLIVFILYSLSRVLILAQYREGRAIIHYLPLKIFYDIVNGFLTAYLYIRYISGAGVKLRWGHKSEVVH